MDVQHVILRSTVRQEILNCERCHLYHTATKPVPFDGPSPNQLMILGEAPGKTEDKEGLPFVGKSGTLLRQLLNDAGFVLSDLTFANSVCCFPDRTPTAGEVDACNANLRRQFQTVRPQYVIAAGGIAVSALCRTAVRMGEVRGIWFRPSRLTLDYDCWVLATYHPAAILRNRTLQDVVEQDLEYVRLMVKDEMEPSLGQFCLRCKNPDVTWTDDLPWCAKHQPKPTKGT